jgi:hypothetical protein
MTGSNFYSRFNIELFFRFKGERAKTYIIFEKLVFANPFAMIKEKFNKIIFF